MASVSSRSTASAVLGALTAPLLAAWLGATLAVGWAATGTFEVLSASRNPALARRLDPIEAPRREVLLRHAAGEVNRNLFRGWVRAQAGLAGLVFLAALMGAAPAPAGGRRWMLALAVLLAVIAMAQGLWFAPGLERLGRALDFADRAKEADAVRRFGLLHAAYTLSDLGKAVLLAAGLWLAWKGEREVGKGR